MTEKDEFPLEHLDAIERKDLAHVARAMTLEDLEKMKLAEEVFDLHFKRRSGKLAIATQAILSLVAIGGIFQNAYQTYQNGQQQSSQQRADQERWNREFKRAKEADKYRAFFETSALATDPANPDKRLVGYALLQEFVRDEEYNGKATLLLEQALDQELRRDKEPGLGEASRSVVVTILGSLSGTSDCKALEQAARSVDGIARRLAQTHDKDEAAEVFDLYVRSLVGRAPLACNSFDEIRQVWQPLRQALQRNPVMGGLAGKAPTAPEADARIVEILRDRCVGEVQLAGSSDCGEVFERYAQHCARAGPEQSTQTCRILTDTAKELSAKSPARAGARG